MYFKQIFEPKLAQYAYLVGCQETKKAIIVDPLRDIDLYFDIAKQDGMTIVAATETHIHADYLSGLRQFAEQENIAIYASDEGDKDWKYFWLVDSSYNYSLVTEGDKIEIGKVTLTVKKTPGHTPEHLAFLVTDNSGENKTPEAMLSGDFVFVGDVGRPDLLETAAGQIGSMSESAVVLFDSIQLFKDYAPDMILWPGHGAGSACGKSLGAAPNSTVGQELETNASIGEANVKENFVNYILSGQPEPPPYFARMKNQNKFGPPVFEKLPEPKEISASDIAGIQSEKNIVLVDTRSWAEFNKGHLPKSLFIPTTSAFSTLVGSYIDSVAPICLICDREALDESIRHCVRVGVDNVKYFLPVSELNSMTEPNGHLFKIDEIEVAELSQLISSPDAYLLDVRRSFELSSNGKIGDALNISHSQISIRLNELPKDKKLIVYCETGSRSKYVSAFLASKGYRVANLIGGAVEWKKLN